MWTEKAIEINDTTFTYCVKHFEEPSEAYGIDGGRITKLNIQRKGIEVYNYDRGLDKAPADADTEKALAEIMKMYN